MDKSKLGMEKNWWRWGRWSWDYCLMNWTSGTENKIKEQ